MIVVLPDAAELCLSKDVQDGFHQDHAERVIDFGDDQ
jgi:hypothetical protein